MRIVLGPLVLSSVLFPQLYQPLLDRLWIYLFKNPAYNWSTFETLWTVFWYAAIEVPLTVVFMKHPEWRFTASKTPEGSGRRRQGNKRSKPRGMRRPSRRIGEIAVYVAPLLLLDLVMVKKFADVPIQDIVRSGGYHVLEQFSLSNFSAGGNTSMATDELSSSIVRNTMSTLPHKTFLVPTLHNFSLSSPLQLIRALPPSAPSSRRLVFELVISFILYDFLFFIFHLSLHAVPILRRWHAPHHMHDAQLNPQVTNQLSVLERLGLVLLANFSLNIIKSHVLTRTVFVPLFVWLLVEIHSGMDLPWGYEKVLPPGWGHGAMDHWIHHKEGRGGYSPFFRWVDAVWAWFCGRGE